MIPLFVGLSNIPSLHALQGSAIVDPSLGPGEITVDDKLNFALNDGVFVRNLRTGEGTRAIVGNRVYDSSIEARLSREIAGKIGISESEGGIIELLSLDEALAQGYMDPFLALAQSSSTLPPKEASPPSPKASDTGTKPEVPPPASSGNSTPSAIDSAPPGRPSSESSNSANARDDQRSTNGNDLAKTDVPETNLPPEPRSSSTSSIAGLSSPIKDRPVPEKNLGTPETTLPKVPVSGDRNASSPAIQDTPAIKGSASSNEGMPTIEDEPQISIPASPIVTQADRAFNINEEPMLENALVTPETNLPDRNPTLAKEDEAPAIHEAPAIAEIAMAPEINLPAETLWSTSEREEPRINETPKVNTANPGTENPWGYPEINLPAENLSSTRESEDPRIKEAPDVNTSNLAQKNPWDYNSDEYDIALVPAEKRPPAERGTVTIPPEAEIPPISNSPKSVTSGLSPEGEIPPVSNNLSGTSGRNGSSYLDPALAIAPLENGQSRNATPSSSSGLVQGSRFSVPLITTLEKGKYYVQLVAFSKTELIEPELSKIGRSYPLAIQIYENPPKGSREHPLYRILLGPMNLGESGAMLQRFKGIGYTDAFVRQGS
jgi:hypothetical protein